MPLDIRSQVVTALDNVNKNPELYTPPKPTTPLETRINDLKETNPNKYREHISTLTSSANSGNEEARELLGKVGEDAARQRRGYEGLNEFMTASTGGLPGIIANYLPKTIGSAWNGYSMFDPNSPGIVTKSYQEAHPKTSFGLNLALGITAGYPFIVKQKPLKSDIPITATTNTNKPIFYSKLNFVKNNQNNNVTYFDIFAGKNNNIGTVALETIGNNQAHIHPELNRNWRGKGFGKAVYLNMQQRYPNLQIRSYLQNAGEQGISEAAKHVWESLMKDGAAYSIGDNYLFKSDLWKKQ